MLWLGWTDGYWWCYCGVVVIRHGRGSSWRWRLVSHWLPWSRREDSDDGTATGGGSQREERERE
ncbi:hypothetical protein M6B38_371645 [Iris pallida]|uniref:Uncharacterized protein n=1 Tax=Iris pallida TaxID=29817 RepID=A0AAX6GCX8_IRIPA|nr:hypothetical protein M6B38_371645 [Iris pallida]